MSGWCTNWSAYNVEALWKMVSGEDDPRGWEQASAWRSMEQSVQQQRARLVAAKQALQEKWPADKSEAAAAFVQELDILIASMDQTAVAAARTKAALDGIMTELANTKRQLQPVYEEYKKKSSDLILRQLDGAEDELDTKARQIIAKSEQVIAQHTANIIPPPKYKLADRVTLPPTTPQPPIDGGKDAGSTGRATAVPPVPHSPPPALAGMEPVLPEGQQWEPSGSSLAPPPAVGTAGTGPVLTGGPPGLVLPPVVTDGLPPGAPPSPPPPQPGPGVPGVSGVPPVGGLGSPPVGPLGGGAGRGAPAARVPVKGAMPSGAVIGQAPPAQRPIGKGMPPGGVIGGSAPGTARGTQGGRSAGPGGRAGMGAVPLGANGRPAGRRPQDDEGVGGDPDNPWEVAEGVTPVIEPTGHVERHDPGPGVIGMDR